MGRSREEEMERIARLSGLHLSDEEKEILFSDLGRIVPYMERICALDTSSAKKPPLKEAELRPDEAEGSTLAAEILKQAPQADDGMFTVPKIV